MFRLEQAENKLPMAPLFVQASGKAWNKDDWKGPIKEAAAIGVCSFALGAITL